MPVIQLVNETTGRTLARDLSLALRLTSRFMGLMGRTRFSDDAAMGLSQCNWVHTFLVKFPIDLVYCDNSGKALTVVSNLHPNRFAPRVRGAYWAYEMRGGRLAPFVSMGDRLKAEPRTGSATMTREAIPCE